MAPNDQPPTATPSIGEYALQGLSVSFDVLAAFAEKLPFPAAPIFSLAKSVIVNVETVQGNAEDCAVLKDHVGQLLPVVLAAMEEESKRPPLAVPAQLKQHVGQFYKTLKKIDETIAEVKKATDSKRKRDKIITFVMPKWYTNKIKKCREDLERAMRLFAVADQLETSLAICGISRQIEAVAGRVEVVIGHVEGVAEEVAHVSNVVEDTSTKVATVLTNTRLESLPRSKRASSNCSRPDRPGGCFEGTRVETIKTIREWVLNPDPKVPKCFWMNGIAGVGKTTVAYSIAELARDLGILGADFFFSRLGEDELRNPALVFPTLAYQLALSDPEFARVITAALEQDPDAGFASLKEQLDTLIIRPLATLKQDPERIVVLILDAFDECEAKGAKEILQLLVDSLSKLPFFLKIIITSRPEKHIQSVLRPSSNLSITRLHDIEEHVVAEDIKRYLTARLRELPKQPGYEDLSEDWITDAEIQVLVDAAGALFVHAATSLRFLLGEEGFTPRELLDILLAIIQAPRATQASSTNPYADLDTLYQRILIALVSRTSGTGSVLSDRFQRVVGTIILLRDPLPIAALSKLIQLDQPAVTALLSTVQSVILFPSSPDDCPRVYHPSFPDFLQNSLRCTDDRLRIDTRTHEARIALRCLEIMNAFLHKDMLGLFETCLLNSEVPDRAERVKAAFCSELQYACRHWASHLAAAPHPADSRILEALDTFSSRSLLPWLEAVSWLELTRSAIPSLEAANAWVAKSTCSPTTITLLNDGYRLSLAHFTTITQSAPHIARSVLPFAPKDVQLTSTYATYAEPNIKVIDGADLEWSACLMTLKGHTEPVSSVAISPDGTRIVSGSEDSTLCIWNANNGDAIAVLKGHTDYIRSVAFSPEGDRIISGSDDGTIRVWDATTCRELSRLEGHSGWVRTVSFSPDGGRIASGSDDRTIQIWDAVAGDVLRTLEGHSSFVLSVVFFPDGKRLTSGSNDHTLRVWNLEDGDCVARLEGHSKEVLGVAVSPDGLQIVSGSADRTLRLWDVSTSTCIGTLQGHTGSIRTVAFSSNGSRIVSGSEDISLRLWDPTTHQNIATYNGHGDYVLSVALSPDGRRIISGSEDKSIKVWDSSIVQGNREEGDMAHLVVSLAVSSDRSRLAVLTWDLTLEQMVVQLRDPTRPRGSKLGSITLIDSDWKEYGLSFRTRFLADDTRVVVTRDHDGVGFVYDTSNGNRIGELENPDSEPPRKPLFTLEGENILRHNASSASIACILPPSLQASDIAPFEVDGEAGHRILVGCQEGRILTLHVT